MKVKVVLGGSKAVIVAGSESGFINKVNMVFIGWAIGNNSIKYMPYKWLKKMKEFCSKAISFFSWIILFRI